MVCCGTHKDKNLDSNMKRKLVKLCQKRFVARRVAFKRFWEQLPAIMWSNKTELYTRTTVKTKSKSDRG